MLQSSSAEAHTLREPFSSSFAGVHRVTRTFLWWGLIAPVVLTVIYGITLSQVPRDWQPWFNGEYGPVEIVGAMLFLIGGLLSARLALDLGREGEPVPVACKAWFWLFAVAGVLMFMEEISWGQHLFQWESPEFFVEHNKQAETNLHNLAGDTPSRLLRRVADIGLPVFALVLPAIMVLGKDAWERGHWPRYFLPRFELALWTSLSILVRPVRKWIETHWPEQYRSSLSEYQELIWAAAFVLYLVVMAQRLRPRATAPAVEPPAA
jgi:hypothetical protein